VDSVRCALCVVTVSVTGSLVCILDVFDGLWDTSRPDYTSVVVSLSVAGL
jgi:hypothetical protein